MHITALVSCIQDGDGFPKPQFFQILLLTLISCIKRSIETAVLKGPSPSRHIRNYLQPFISECCCSYRRRSRLSFSFQINVHSAADAMISTCDSSSMAEAGFFVIAVQWGCMWWTNCILRKSILDTARAVKFCAFSPGFFGVRVKEPFTVRQWELSPPQTPHLSSTLVEPISLSQPTFWRQPHRRDVGLTLMQL